MEKSDLYHTITDFNSFYVHYLANMNQAFTGERLNVTGMRCMVFIRANGRSTQKELSERFGIDMAYLSRTVKALLNSGYLTKEDNEAAAMELHSIIDIAESEDVLDEDASDLVSAAIDFQDISASEVMTARVDIIAIDIDDPWEEILRTIDSSPYSRIPVYEDSIDHVIGILSLNRFLKAMIDKDKVEIRSLLLPTCYVYKTMKLPAVLSSLRNAQQHIAVVTDEYGGTLGVVSMEDVLEQLVGDIWDETDTVEKDVVKQGDGKYELDGDTPIYEFLELMGWKEDDFDFDSETVGGWCIEYNNGFPNVNSTFKYRDIEVTIMEVSKRRVRRVKVQVKREE